VVVLLVVMVVWWRRSHRLRRKKNDSTNRRASASTANPVFSTLGVGEAMASQERSLVDYTLPRTATVHDRPAMAPATYEVIDEDSAGLARRGPLYSSTAPGVRAAAAPPPPPAATGAYEEPVPLHVQKANGAAPRRQGQRGPVLMLDSEHYVASVPTPHKADGDSNYALPSSLTFNATPSARTSYATPSVRTSNAAPSARTSYAMPHLRSTAVAEEPVMALPTPRRGVRRSRGNGLQRQASDA